MVENGRPDLLSWLIKDFLCSGAKFNESPNSTKLQRKISFFSPSATSLHACTQTVWKDVNLRSFHRAGRFRPVVSLIWGERICGRGSLRLHADEGFGLQLSFAGPVLLRKTMEGIGYLVPKRAKPRREQDNTGRISHRDGFIGNIGTGEIRLGMKLNRLFPALSVPSFTCPQTSPHCPLRAVWLHSVHLPKYDSFVVLLHYLRLCTSTFQREFLYSFSPLYVSDSCSYFSDLDFTFTAR